MMPLSFRLLLYREGGARQVHPRVGSLHSASTSFLHAPEFRSPEPQPYLEASTLTSNKASRKVVYAPVGPSGPGKLQAEPKASVLCDHYSDSDRFDRTRHLGLALLEICED